MSTVWQVHPAEPERAAALARSLGLRPLTAQILLNRGLTDRAQAERFLHPALAALEDPFALAGMAKAVQRLRRAIAAGEPVVIFGDSDVDGLTAGVILHETLRGLGAMVRARQSNRIADGYGLPHRLVQQLVRSSTKLLVLVDCGTNQPEAIRQLADSGIDTIVVDHHVPLGEPAHPSALINPHCAAGTGPPQAAPFGTPVAHPASGGVPGLGWGLSSAGLAFKLSQALLEAGERGRLDALVDLAALGTLADCSPLLGDNRILIAAGLSRLVESHRPGLRRLCEATGTRKPEPEHILRRLVPRLNASGRLGDPAAVWHLLRAEPADAGAIEEWLEAAETAHARTKELHRRVIGQAQEQVNRMHFRDQYVMMVSGDWPQGLMGPLAAQLAQRYGRPAIAIALGERHGVGSGRSIPLFNLLAALQACEGLLMRFGGHAQACGLTLDRKHLEPFRSRMNEQAQASLGRDGLRRTRTIDLELPLAAMEAGWIGELERLAPFGQGNPRPTVACRRLRLEARSARTAVLSDGAQRVAARGMVPLARDGERYDVVASPSLAGGELVLTVTEVRPAQPAAAGAAAGTAL